MGTLSTFTKNAMLDAAFGSGTPATYYAALYNNGDEVSASGYARVAVTNNETNFPAASNGAKSNGTQINFPTPEAAWTWDEVRLYDAASAGNLVASHAVSERTALAGEPVYIAAGALDLTLTDPA